MKRFQKGQPGYRDAWHRRQGLLILVFALLILLQLAARGLTDSLSLKRILTVSAILTVLPAANLAAPFLATIRMASLPSELAGKLAGLERKGLLLTELMISSGEGILPAQACLVTKDRVLILGTESGRGSAGFSSYLEGMFAKHRLSFSVRIVFREEDFFCMAEKLPDARPAKPTEEMRLAGELLLSLSI